jgi:hypothetical protein
MICNDSMLILSIHTENLQELGNNNIDAVGIRPQINHMKRALKLFSLFFIFPWCYNLRYNIMQPLGVYIYTHHSYPPTRTELHFETNTSLTRTSTRSTLTVSRI